MQIYHKLTPQGSFSDNYCPPWVSVLLLKSSTKILFRRLLKTLPFLLNSDLMTNSVTQEAVEVTPKNTKGMGTQLKTKEHAKENPKEYSLKVKEIDDLLLKAVNQ